MTKGTFQSSSDAIDFGRGQTRPVDSQKSGGGSLQLAGATECELGHTEIDPPYSDPGNRGPVQLGGADEVELKKGGRNFAFSNQASGVEKSGKR